MTSNQAVTLTDRSQFTISVFGSDEYIADAPATWILTRNVLAPALPLALEVTLPDDASARIEHKSNRSDDSRFYMTRVFLDVDGDGRLCEGDLRRDFTGVTDLFAFGPDGPGGPVDIPLTAYGAMTCRSFIEDLR